MVRKKKNVTQVENEALEAQATEAAEANEAASEVAQPTTPEGTKAESKPICLVPGCGRDAKIRGLCARCGTAARKAIKDGKATWESLEREGLALAPKHKAFGGEPGLFSKALAAKLADKKD